nr:acyltransferase domain-containing protein [Actinomycetota bacterium]
MADHQIAVLFPGQGAFDGAALVTAARRYPQVEQVFKDMDSVTGELFGRRLSEVLFAEDTPDIGTLLADEPWVSQLAIFGSDVAAYRILVDNGLRPDVLVGHSLGEIAALVSASVYSLADGARIVAARVAALGEPSAGTMAALTTDGDRARRIIDVIGDEFLAVAVENHAEQTVLSGPPESVAQAVGVARQVGIGATELNSPFAFHNPALAPSVPGFAAAVAEHVTHPIDVPVYSPTEQRYYSDDDPLADLLAAHLVKPVLFGAAVSRLHDDGVRVFVEAGCGGALSKLVGKILRADPAVRPLPSLSLDSDGALSLEATLAELGGVADPVAVLAAALAPGTSRARFDRFWQA